MSIAKTAPKFRVTIDARYCKGCGLCVHFCPKGHLKLSSAKNRKGYHVAEFVGGDCTGCLRCGLICPDAAVKIVREE